MKKELETSTKEFSFLGLGEAVRGDLFRGHRGYYVVEPDEKICMSDLVVNNGRIHLAKRIAGGDTVSSAMAHVAVGTATAAAALTDTTLPGEVGRKATAINSALTNNVFSAVATFGGFADSVTSLQMTEAGLFNHASSGNGTMFQRVTFASVVLANSDIFRITLETNVGSNTI